MRMAAPLVVNAMFYIESLGTEIGSVEPGRDTPPAEHGRWFQQPNRRHKLSSALTRDGYALVHMVGKEVAGFSAESRHGDVRTHWRRGHWRQQHHGPANSLLKRVWIRPLMVNPNKSPDEVTGHIYAVSSGTATKH